jgi:hypothetical protein
MTDEKDRVIATINRLAGSVVGAIREGSAEDRRLLAGQLRAMEAGIPGESGGAADARVFLAALVSLLEGNPISHEDAKGLSEPYSGIYARITASVLKAGDETGPEARDEMKDFLTQLAASVVLMMRKGTEEDRRNLAAKLLEIKAGMSPDQKGAADLILAFTAILEGKPFDPESLPQPYSGFLKKVRQSIA